MAGTAYKDHSEDLRFVLQNLEDTGIPVHTWTTTELARHFITTESFIANVRTIAYIDNSIVHDYVIPLAIQRGFWTENCKCTPTTMMKFCNFLKSKQGSEILADFHKKANFSAIYVHIVKMTYVSKLSRQLTEFPAAKKRRSAEIEADITYHRCQIELLKKRLEKEIIEVESCYLPASQYVPLDEQELLKRCYNMYLEML